MKTKIFLAILCVCFSINLYSQEGEIIYTDFEPDTAFVVPRNDVNPGISFDINYDNNNDFRFYYGDGSAGVIDHYISCFTWDWQVACVYDFLNDSITSQDYRWNIYQRVDYVNPKPYEGQYLEKEYKIALKHDLDDTNSCYGWIRLQFKYGWGIPATITIYDMAYCTVPNYPLIFGQKSFDDTLINDTSEFKDYVLFPSPADDKITLKFNNHYYNTTDNEIKIYGIDGRLLKTQNSDFDNIDISNLSSGVYIMKIYLGNGESYTEKFVKK